MPRRARRPARLTALALLAACCAAFAPAPARREPKAKSDRRTDEQRIQGTWAEVSHSVGGKVLPCKGRVGLFKVEVPAQLTEG